MCGPTKAFTSPYSHRRSLEKASLEGEAWDTHRFLVSSNICIKMFLPTEKKISELNFPA